MNAMQFNNNNQQDARDMIPTQGNNNNGAQHSSFGASQQHDARDMIPSHSRATIDHDSSFDGSHHQPSTMKHDQQLMTKALFVCDLCTKSFVRFCNFKQHVDSHYDNNGAMNANRKPVSFSICS